MIITPCSWKSWVKRDPGKSACGDFTRVSQENGLFLLIDFWGNPGDPLTIGQVTVNRVVTRYAEQRKKNQTYPGNKVERALFHAIDSENRAIWNMRRESNRKFGAVFASCVLWQMDEQMYITVANSGDARVYIFSGSSGKLRQLSEDHSVMWKYFSSGRISKEELRTSPFKNRITASIGASPYISPYFSTTLMDADDMVLLCSDGIWSLLSEDRMQDIISNTYPDPGKTVDSLAEQAENQGLKDDACLIVTTPVL